MSFPRALLVLLAPGLIAANAPIEIAVTNVTVAKGNVHVDVCPEKQFTSPNCPWSGDAPAKIGTTIVTVRDVPPGRYGAQGFHDINGNGKIDRNFLGIPKEPVGFSNDAPIHMAPPHFADAAFEHGNTPQRITFRLRNLP